MSTGMPAWTTTTVRGLAAATASTRMDCSPGNDRFVRSFALGLLLLGIANQDDGDVRIGGCSHGPRDAVERQTLAAADLDQHEWAKIESSRHFDRCDPGPEYDGPSCVSPANRSAAGSLR